MTDIFKIKITVRRFFVNIYNLAPRDFIVLDSNSIILDKKRKWYFTSLIAIKFTFDIYKGMTQYLYLQDILSVLYTTSILHILHCSIAFNLNC